MDKLIAGQQKSLSTIVAMQAEHQAYEATIVGDTRERAWRKIPCKPWM
jgi:hypothetical protein